MLMPRRPDVPESASSAVIQFDVARKHRAKLPLPLQYCKGVAGIQFSFHRNSSSRFLRLKCSHCTRALDGINLACCASSSLPDAALNQLAQADPLAVSDCIDFG